MTPQQALEYLGWLYPDSSAPEEFQEALECLRGVVRQLHSTKYPDHEVYIHIYGEAHHKVEFPITEGSNPSELAVKALRKVPLERADVVQIDVYQNTRSVSGGAVCSEKVASYKDPPSLMSLINASKDPS